MFESWQLRSYPLLGAKKAKLVVLSWWEGHALSHLSVSVMLGNHGRLLAVRKKIVDSFFQKVAEDSIYGPSCHMITD